MIMLLPAYRRGLKPVDQTWSEQPDDYKKTELRFIENLE